MLEEKASPREPRVAAVLIVVAVAVVVAIVLIMRANRNENATTQGRDSDTSASAVDSDLVSQSKGETNEQQLDRPAALGSQAKIARSVPVTSGIPGRTTSPPKTLNNGASATAAPPVLALVEARRAFRTVAESVFKRLPTMASMKGITEEQAHGVPNVIQSAGDQLGQIAESLAQDPRLAKDGLQFYGQCYRRSDLVPQVRAVCLADFRHWRKLESNSPIGPDDLKGVPRQVIDLAAQIPD